MEHLSILVIADHVSIAVTWFLEELNTEFQLQLIVKCLKNIIPKQNAMWTLNLKLLTAVPLIEEQSWNKGNLKSLNSL